jgi:hypothetical protein
MLVGEKVQHVLTGSDVYLLPEDGCLAGADAGDKFDGTLIKGNHVAVSLIGDIVSSCSYLVCEYPPRVSCIENVLGNSRAWHELQDTVFLAQVDEHGCVTVLADGIRTCEVKAGELYDFIHSD